MPMAFLEYNLHFHARPLNFDLHSRSQGHENIKIEDLIFSLTGQPTKINFGRMPACLSLTNQKKSTCLLLNEGNSNTLGEGGLVVICQIQIISAVAFVVVTLLWLQQSTSS